MNVFDVEMKFKDKDDVSEFRPVSMYKFDEFDHFLLDIHRIIILSVSFKLLFNIIN